MWRASLTFVVAVVVTILAGIPALTVGLVLPRRWCFEPAYFLWSCGLLLAAGVRLTVEGRAHFANQPFCFLVGNHQSALDIPVLVALTHGRVRFLAKRSLFHIPIVGWCMRLYGFVPIDRSNTRKAKKAIDELLQRQQHKKQSLVVFPEGTRSTDGMIAAFRPGALKICQRVGMPLVPFAIDGSMSVHRARVFNIRPGPVHVALSEPIRSGELAAVSAADLAERVRKEVLRLHERCAAAVTGAIPLAVADHGGRP